MAHIQLARCPHRILIICLLNLISGCFTGAAASPCAVHTLSLSPVQHQDTQAAQRSTDAHRGTLRSTHSKRSAAAQSPVSSRGRSLSPRGVPWRSPGRGAGVRQGSSQLRSSAKGGAGMLQTCALYIYADAMVDQGHGIVFELTAEAAS